MKPNKAELKYTRLYRAELSDRVIHKRHKKDMNRYWRHIDKQNLGKEEHYDKAGD